MDIEVEDGTDSSGGDLLNHLDGGRWNVILPSDDLSNGLEDEVVGQVFWVMHDAHRLVSKPNFHGFDGVADGFDDAEDGFDHQTNL
ncbi:hypothetical protein L6452_22317 [Arctium lappa]|uniref:Uncharacterized protein n=1 Tax=Arctium lappa TaxID=4217 RepID=A0ACB9B151_ARCLA|nr:hypothetical protein L6452_22317 [Arctium lappa]